MNPFISLSDDEGIYLAHLLEREHENNRRNDEDQPEELISLLRKVIGNGG
jgi:hypothetical protein